MTESAPARNPFAADRRRAVVIQHVAFEDLGSLGSALTTADFGVTMLQAGVADLSALAHDAPELLIVLGGPIGVYERAVYPWLHDETALLAERLARRLPTLGICLGAQLMAAALGAGVYPGTRGKEIGWSAIRPAGAGDAANPLIPLFEPGVQVLHWHGDTFDLPDGATRLASTALTPNQAFALGETALALQFHAEADGAAIEPWLIGHTCELGHAGVSVPDLRAQSAALRDAAAAAGAAMLSDWLDRCPWPADRPRSRERRTDSTGA